jgi:SAM-dependent methyltransferase
MKGVRRSYELFRAFRHERTDPETFYRMLADDTVSDVARYCQLNGATVLDVGGASGYVADVFRESGSLSVTAEYDFRKMIEHGRRLVNGVAADGCALPIASESVDISYSSNVLEHVPEPKRMLSEMVRVVSPGGIVYITFTNWLSPWGGHATSPWHYVGGEWAAKRYERIHGVPPKTLFGRNLFNLSISDVLQWCEQCQDVTVLDAFPRYYPRWAKSLVKVPGVRELFTWNLVVVMRRGSPALGTPVLSALANSVAAVGEPQ